MSSLWRRNHRWPIWFYCHATVANNLYHSETEASGENRAATKDGIERKGQLRGGCSFVLRYIVCLRPRKWTPEMRRLLRRTYRSLPSEHWINQKSNPRIFRGISVECVTVLSVWHRNKTCTILQIQYEGCGWWAF